MSAGFHECRRCKGSLQVGCSGCKSKAGNVPLHPLSEPMGERVRVALATIALQRAFSQLVETNV